MSTRSGGTHSGSGCRVATGTLRSHARPRMEAAVTTLALEYFRSSPRYIGARTVGSRAPGLLSGPLAPLRLVNIKEPAPPDGHDGWRAVKPLLAGICGSDL